MKEAQPQTELYMAPHIPGALCLLLYAKKIICSWYKMQQIILESGSNFTENVNTFDLWLIVSPSSAINRDLEVS